MAIYGQMVNSARLKTTLSPLFDDDNGCIVIRAKSVFQNQDSNNEWHDLPSTAPSVEFTVGQDVYVDWSTMQRVTPNAEGAVNVVGAIVLADADMLGITALKGQPIYSALRAKFETYTVVNGILTADGRLT